MVRTAYRARTRGCGVGSPEAGIDAGVASGNRASVPDVTLQANRPALAAFFAYVPTSQVLLGSDYPFDTSTDSIRGLEEYGLKPSDLDAIYHRNAELRSKAHERI
jgi:hypothetical protein